MMELWNVEHTRGDGESSTTIFAALDIGYTLICGHGAINQKCLTLMEIRGGQNNARERTFV